MFYTPHAPKSTIEFEQQKPKAGANARDSAINPRKSL